MDGHDLTSTLHSSNKHASYIRKAAVDSGFPPGQIQDGRYQTLDLCWLLRLSIRKMTGALYSEHPLALKGSHVASSVNLYFKAVQYLIRTRNTEQLLLCQGGGFPQHKITGVNSDYMFISCFFANRLGQSISSGLLSEQMSHVSSTGAITITSSQVRSHHVRESGRCRSMGCAASVGGRHRLHCDER
jgi:hypothetical protein